MAGSCEHCNETSGFMKCGVNLSLKAMPYLKRLVAGFPPRRPGFASGQHMRFVVDKAAFGQVLSEYFGFPCQSFHQNLHHN
jgi:hypothetical protein